MYWRRKWQPTPVFLPGESQGQGSLVGCRLWGRTESDTTEVTQQQQQQVEYGVPSWLSGKEFACNVGDLGLMPVSEDSLGKEMATPSGTLACKIPWIEESGSHSP